MQVPSKRGNKIRVLLREHNYASRKAKEYCQTAKIKLFLNKFFDYKLVRKLGRFLDKIKLNFIATL